MIKRTFVASTFWRGSMHLRNMRTFDDEQEAIDYVHKAFKREWPRFSFTPSLCKVYEIFEDKAPRLIKVY